MGLSIGLVLVVAADSDRLWAQAKNLSVTVSITPQVYFLEKIGGNRADIHVLLPTGRDPHSYAPTPNQVAKLVKSDLLFLIGVPFEHALLPKIRTIAKRTRIVQTQKGINKRALRPAHKNRRHEEEHIEKKNDPHIWLSPLLVKIMAKTIFHALIESDPGSASYYSARYESFLEELDGTHHRITTALAPLAGRTMYVFHPAFGYFADTYRLKQQAVEIEGKKPKIKDLAVLIKKAKQKKVRVIFVQPQFDQNAARTIAEAIGGAVVTLDPLARNYLSNLEVMAQTIRQALH